MSLYVVTVEVALPNYGNSTLENVTADAAAMAERCATQYGTTGERWYATRGVSVRIEPE